MLAKKNRADKKAVERVFKDGRFINSPSLTFKFLITGASFAPRISFVAPKTIAKKATERNSLRRRGYSALASHLPSFPSGVLGVFIYKRYQDDISILRDEIKNIASKVN